MDLKRWWIYQQERFPVGSNGLLILIFSSAAVCYSILLRDAASRSIAAVLPPIGIAFPTVFLFFLQLRIADEFKDAQEDAVYRPYRPVPRGLIRLRELAIVGLAAAAIQLGLAAAIGLPLLLLLLLVWAYMALMRQEFFVVQWLKAHPLVYLLSHAVILPLMALYATACDWIRVERIAPIDLGWFLMLSFFTSVAIELGRKIRAPQDEEVGVATYSVLWGQRRAAIAWLGAVGLMGLAAFEAARSIQFGLPIAVVIGLLLVGSGVSIRQVLGGSTSAKQIEILSALWTIFLYSTLGIIPFLIHVYSFR
jgi:hypothetical protein